MGRRVDVCVPNHSATAATRAATHHITTTRAVATAASRAAAARATGSILLGVLAPELVDELRGDEVGRVHGDEAQHQTAVLLQVAEDEVLADELAQVRLLLHELDAVLDVLVAHVREEAAHHPGRQVVEVHE